MNRKTTLAAALLCAASGAAIADDITIDPDPFVSSRTRAEVRAELDGFRSAGVNPWADDYAPLAHFRGSRTRADVQAEFLASRAAVSALTGEDSGSMYFSRNGAPAAVRALELAKSADAQ